MRQQNVIDIENIGHKIIGLGIENQRFISNAIDLKLLHLIPNLKEFDTKITNIWLEYKSQISGSGYYVWRTSGDGKVRDSHVENDGKIFSWDDPPATGHPGEDYNCRCEAIDLDFDSLEIASSSQTLISKDIGNTKSWNIFEPIGNAVEQVGNAISLYRTNSTFINHFYAGFGRGLHLSQTEYYDQVIDRASEKMFPKIVRDIENQIKSEKMFDGQIFGDLEGNVNFEDIAFSLGSSTVNVTYDGYGSFDKNSASIDVNVLATYQFYDQFTDPFSIRENDYGTSDLSQVNIDLLERIRTEGGGIAYEINGSWETSIEILLRFNI